MKSQLLSQVSCLSLPRPLRWLSTASWSSPPLISTGWSVVFSKEVQIRFLSFFFVLFCYFFPPSLLISVLSHFSPFHSRLFFLLHLKTITCCNNSHNACKEVFIHHLLVWQFLKPENEPQSSFWHLAQ